MYICTYIYIYIYIYIYAHSTHASVAHCDVNMNPTTDSTVVANMKLVRLNKASQGTWQFAYKTLLTLLIDISHSLVH